MIEAQALGIPCVASTNVPKAAKITDGLKYLDLSLGSDNWASAVLDAIGTKFDYSNERIAKAGYDISVESKKVQELFERI